MKQLRGYIVIATVIVIVYALLALWLDRESVRQHEQGFNDQQALQIQLSARSIEDHFAWQLREMQIVARYFIPQYLAADPEPTIPDSVLGGLVGSPGAEGLALGFYESPTDNVMLYARPDQDGERAIRLLNGWLHSYWVPIRDGRQPFVTPFNATSDHPLYGLLLPVYIEGIFAGIVGVTLDFAPVLEQYVIPVRSGKYGAAWVQDAHSRVIYDHEPETIGQYVFRIAAPYPDLRALNRRLMQEDSGQDEYHYTDELGGQVVRKLVAWSTATLGNQRLTIAISAPDTEISAELAISRRQSTVLGALLGLALIGSGGLLYYLRQRTLQKEVAARTSELQQLTAELEQRVARRTTLLEQERAQSHTILEALNEGVIYRQGEQVYYTNAALTTMLGYTNEEIVTRPLEIFRAVTRKVDPAVAANKWQNVAEDLARTGVWRREVRLTRKDGTEFDASVYVTQVRDLAKSADWDSRDHPRCQPGKDPASSAGSIYHQRRA